MKILRVHNFYREPGGEDTVERAERALLHQAGHEVVAFERHSAGIDPTGAWRRASLAARSIWARDAKRELRALVESARPDVAHFTNTFPLISPAAYEACREAGVPVVQSLHNYRLLCPAATLLRGGGICDECVQRGLWRSVRHGCVRGSRGASAVVAAGLALHRARGTFDRCIDLYVAPSEFARRVFEAAGLPPGRLRVKPNFVAPDPGPRDGAGDYALFAGRLAPEKGALTLLRAWREHGAALPLRIAGDGPLRPRLEALAAGAAAEVRFLGHLPREALWPVLKGARLLVFPSEAYETFGLAIAEAFACGVPVVASRVGSPAELVEDGRTGLLFDRADPRDLAEKLAWAAAHAEALEAMGRAARREFEARYTAERNLALLREIYAAARERR